MRIVRLVENDKIGGRVCKEISEEHKGQEECN